MQRENLKRQGSAIDMWINGLCLLLLSLGLFVHAEDTDPHAPIRDKCRDKFGLTDEDLRAAINDPEGMGCFLLCFFKDLSIMDDSGNFYPNAAMEGIEESAKEMAKPVVFSCYEEAKKSMTEDACARALEVTYCIKDQAPDLYKNLGLFHPLGEKQE